VFSCLCSVTNITVLAFGALQSSLRFGTVRDTNCDEETDKCARSFSRAKTPCWAVRVFATILYVFVIVLCHFLGFYQRPQQRSIGNTCVHPRLTSNQGPGTLARGAPRKP
jgi:hypothetical protein